MGERVQEAHLRWCASRGLRANTIVAKRAALARFARAVAPTPAEDASAEQLRQWYETISHCTPGTRACELSHIRQWFAWLRREDVRRDDPTARLDAPRVPRRLPRPIGSEDLSLAVKEAAEPVRSWLLFGALAGLRCWEIAPLRSDDLLLDLVPPMLYVADGKGGHDRTVPLHPRLAELPFRNGYLWPTRRGHVTAGTVSRRINEHFRSLGIRATAHQCRHAFGTRLYETSGGDLLVTQNALGHQSPTHTAGYAAWSKLKAAQAVAAITI